MTHFSERKTLLTSYGNLLTRDQLQTENSWLRGELHKAQQKICADKKAYDMLFKQSQVDFLTQTPTRMILHDRALQAFRLAHRQHSSVLLMFLDIDHFKQINDLYGHEVGDQVLVQLTQRLRQTLRSNDTVCRYGGDEFVLLLPLTHDDHDICKVADKVLACAEQPMVIGGRLLTTAISVGIAMYPLHGNNLADVLLRADAAMYEAKHLGGQRYHLAPLPGAPALVVAKPASP